MQRTDTPPKKTHELTQLDVTAKPEVFIMYSRQAQLATLILQHTKLANWCKHFEETIQQADSVKLRLPINVYKKILQDLKMISEYITQRLAEKSHQEISPSTIVQFSEYKNISPIQEYILRVAPFNVQFCNVANKPLDALHFVATILNRNSADVEEILGQQHPGSLRLLFIYLKHLSEQESLQIKDYQLSSCAEYKTLLVRIAQLYPEKYKQFFGELNQDSLDQIIDIPFESISPTEKIKFLIALITTPLSKRKQAIAAQSTKSLIDLADAIDPKKMILPIASFLMLSAHPAWEETVNIIRLPIASQANASAATAPAIDSTSTAVDYTYTELPRLHYVTGEYTQPYLDYCIQSFSKDPIPFLTELSTSSSENIATCATLLSKNHKIIIDFIHESMHPVTSNIRPDTFLQLLLLPSWKTAYKKMTSLCDLSPEHDVATHYENKVEQYLATIYSTTGIVDALTSPHNGELLIRASTYYHNGTVNEELAPQEYKRYLRPNYLVRKLATLLPNNGEDPEERGITFIQTLLANHLDYFICPLSGKFFIKPSLAADGHTYEEEWIQSYKQDQQNLPTAPIQKYSVEFDNTIVSYILSHPMIRIAIEKQSSPSNPVLAEKIHELRTALDLYIKRPTSKYFPAQTKWKNIHDAVKLIKTALNPADMNRFHSIPPTAILQQIAKTIALLTPPHAAASQEKNSRPN